MSLAAGLLTALCALLPKRNAAVVHTWPAFDDTAQALLPELARCAVRRIYYLAAGGAAAGPVPDWGPRVAVLPKRSLRALWVFLTARYVFFTHQCYTMRFPRKVVAVNLWHGMPIKKVGWLLPGRRGPRARYELATSDFWVPVIQACMRPRDRVLVSGLPRCDRFAALGPAEVRRRLGGAEAAGAKLVVWLPTFRRTATGEVLRDGRDFNNAAQMPGFDADRFAAWLAARNLVCVLKPHPLGPRVALRTAGPLRILDDAALAAAGLTLYTLLGGADALITDVSSVYVDFLALDRPIIHAFADRREYAGNRGFTFPWTDEYFGGPLAEDMAAVEQALADVAAGRDSHREHRARLRGLFHARPGEPATAALLQQVGLAVAPAAGRG